MKVLYRGINTTNKKKKKKYQAEGEKHISMCIAV